MYLTAENQQEIKLKLIIPIGVIPIYQSTMTRLRIKFQIEYDVLAERDYGSVLDEIVRLMTDTYCYASDTVRINKRQIPIQSVRKRLSMVTAEHIEYVISSLEKNKSKIKNMRAYLLTTLYNSIDTMETDCLYGN